MLSSAISVRAEIALGGLVVEAVAGMNLQAQRGSAFRGRRQGARTRAPPWRGRHAPSASHQAPVCSSTTGAPMASDASIGSASASMNRDTRMPAAFSSATMAQGDCGRFTTSSPPSVVRSSRFSGTRQTAWGRTPQRDAQHLAGGRHLEVEGHGDLALAAAAMSSSRIWRRSSRRWAVMPSAPASMASSAARTGSGRDPPRALRMVAT